MKTVCEHDLSKQECHHMLNGLDFVEFSRKFVAVNVIGTQKVRSASSDADQEQAVGDNWASLYWSRDSDPNYQQALQRYRKGRDDRNVSEVSLYHYAAQYTKTWRLSGETKVPHITPNFKSIPKKSGKNKDRYIMFLQSILLVFKAGT